MSSPNLRDDRIASESSDTVGLARALIDASHTPLLLFDGDLRLITASRAFRTASGPENRRQLLDAHDRVMSVAAVQRHLELGAGEVEVGPYLTKLCESLESSMAGEGRATTLTVRADPAVVSSHEVVSLGLIA